MDKTQTIQKFNAMANTFGVFGKSVEKHLAMEPKEGPNILVCNLADMLIEEINELKNQFGCPINSERK